MTPEDLINEPFSSYRLMSSARRICLPPRYLGNVSQGIRDQLDSEINLYCSDLESVVISYENLKLLQAVGSILDDSPFLHFRIQADFLVFKPTIGCILKGVVNKVSKDHVGCLVHNQFNASIHRPRQNLNGWKGSQLQQGEEFPFEVQDIYSNNAVISLKGKLVDQKIIEAYLKSLQAERGSTKAAKDKPVDSGAFIDTVEGEITLDNDPVLKRKRHQESSVSEHINDILDGKLPFAKKKKTKKDEGASDHKYSFISQTPNKMKSVVQRDDVPSTPFAGRKRKHSIETNTVSESEKTLKVGHSSAKKARFDSSNSEKKKLKVQDSSLDDAEISELDDHSFVDSSFLDDSLTQETAKKKKKKKKHKKDKESIGEGLDVTKLKDKSLFRTEMKDNVEEIPFNTLDQDLPLKVWDPDQRSPMEMSEKRKKKKHKEKQKNLVNVVMALQSEVTKVASKLQTPSPQSSRKQKQKKKKHRESSISPERNISADTPIDNSKWKSKSYSFNNRLSANGAGDSDMNVTENMDVSFSESSSKKKKRHSSGDSNVIEVTTKSKKSKTKKEEIAFF